MQDSRDVYLQNWKAWPHQGAPCGNRYIYIYWQEIRNTKTDDGLHNQNKAKLHGLASVALFLKTIKNHRNNLVIGLSLLCS